MPTDHVVAMLSASPPQRAAGVLLAMPKDRIDRLLAAMDGRLIARMLIAAEPAKRAALLTHLDDTRLAAELALLPLVEAAAVLAGLPSERTNAQLDRFSSEHLAMLLAALPTPQRRRLVEVIDPRRLADLRRVGYEKAVVEALRRTAANLQWVPDDTGTNLFAWVFHRVFGSRCAMWTVAGWSPARCSPPTGSSTSSRCRACCWSRTRRPAPRPAPWSPIRGTRGHQPSWSPGPPTTMTGRWDAPW